VILRRKFSSGIGEEKRKYGTRCDKCVSSRFVKRKKFLFVENMYFRRYPQNVCLVLTEKTNPQKNTMGLWIMWITRCISGKHRKNKGFLMWITFVDIVDKWIVLF